MSASRAAVVESGVQGVQGPTDVEAIAFLRDLVAIPSVSGHEAAAAAFVASTAAAWGLASEIDEVGNVIATRRSERPDAPVIMLLGHVDTVPGEIPVRIENGVLHGRGSVDAKGPLAAMLVSAARVRMPVDATIVVVGAVGEETPFSPGARAIAARYRPDACIIGEPSHADGVTLGYKGRLIMSLRVERESAHSAGPDGSAGDAVIALWNDVLAMVQLLNSGKAGAFETIQATVQSMRTGADGLCATGEMVAGFRLPPWITPEDLESRLVSVVQSRAAVTFIGHERAHVSDRNDAVVRALVASIRESGARPRPRLKTGTSDMNVVAPVWGCPIAAYGPGDSSLDHSPREQIEVEEFLRAIGVLEGAIGIWGKEFGRER